MSPTGKAVRVPDELHALLASRVDTHGPITKQVERAILDALAEPEVVEVVEVVEVDAPARATRAVATRAVPARAETATTRARASGRRRRTRAEVATDPCRHPINRRIGTGCALCGATVGR